MKILKHKVVGLKILITVRHWRLVLPYKVIYGRFKGGTSLDWVVEKTKNPADEITRTLLQQYVAKNVIGDTFRPDTNTSFKQGDIWYHGPVGPTGYSGISGISGPTGYSGFAPLQPYEPKS
jgi:hypothetical protein